MFLLPSRYLVKYYINKRMILILNKKITVIVIMFLLPSEYAYGELLRLLLFLTDINY